MSVIMPHCTGKLCTATVWVIISPCTFVFEMRLPKMMETIFVKNVFDMYFIHVVFSLAHVLSTNMKGRGL